MIRVWRITISHSFNHYKIMFKYIKLVNTTKVGIYTIHCYNIKNKYRAIVTATDKGGNYIQITLIKHKYNSASSMLQFVKREVHRWVPPAPIRSYSTVNSVYMFEYWHSKRAETSHFEGIDWFYFSGLRSPNWPSLMVQKHYAPRPSLIDLDANDDDDFELSETRIQED